MGRRAVFWHTNEKKICALFFGVLAKDCGLTGEQLKFRKCIRIVLYPTEKYFGKILMHSVQLFTIELLINFRNCPCECNLWTKCLLHQPFSVWESCICLVWDKLLCMFYWSLNWVAFGLFPLCWKFELNCLYLNCLGIAFWFIVVNFTLFVLVLFGFVGWCCCWFFFLSEWVKSCVQVRLAKKEGVCACAESRHWSEFCSQRYYEFEEKISVDAGWRRDFCHCSVPSGSAQGSPGPGLDE